MSKESDFERPGAATKRFCVAFTLIFYISCMTLLKVAHYLDYFKIEIEAEEGFLKELFVALEWFV